MRIRPDQVPPSPPPPHPRFISVMKANLRLCGLQPWLQQGGTAEITATPSPNDRHYPQSPPALPQPTMDRNIYLTPPPPTSTLLSLVLRVPSPIISARQCCESMTFWCGSGSCYFRHWPSRSQQKTNFLTHFFLLITFWRYIYNIF